MTGDRSEIAIAVAEAIHQLIDAELHDPNDPSKDAGLIRAQAIIKTFIAASRLQQAPKRGRPRNKETAA